MAQTFKAKTLLAASGRFSHEAIAPNLIYNTGEQNISGIKNFYSRPTVNGTGVLLSGEAASLPITIVYTTGNQTISGTKTFANNLEVQGTGIFNALDLSNISEFHFSGTNINLINGNVNISGGTIYISGNPVLTGVNSSSFATVANLASTGSALNNSIISLSGLFTGFTGALDAAFASDAQLYTTGSTLDSKINSLSGYVTGTDATLTTNLASTGSTLNIRINNLSGYINSSASNIVFTTGNQIISGIKTFAENTTFGDTGQGDFLVISGNNFTVYGSGNFTSGLFVNGNAVLTGVDLSSYATLVNLASTGSTLDTKINSLSGYVTGTNSTFTTNLFSTGSTLNTKINNLSGYINSTGSNIVFTTGDQTISGVKNFASRPTVNGTGVLLSGEAASLPITIVYTTGDQAISGNKTFLNNINVSGSGIFNALDLSNISEFNFSGTNINLINGNVNISGQIYISGNPVLTGVNLSSYATTANLASTGSTLQTNINNLSGYINSSSSNIVFTTGDQTISGNKTFNNNVVISENLNVTGSIIAKNIIAPNYENLLISGYSSAMVGSDINIIPGISPFSIGKINLTAAGDQVQGNINLKGNVDINNYGDNFGGPSAVPLGLGHKFIIYKSGINLYNHNASFESFEVNQTGVYTLNKTPIYSDGQIYISGNPVLTGVDLSSYATTINLILTGSTLDTKINNLSGYVNAQDNSISNNLTSTGSTLDNKINSLSGAAVLKFDDQIIYGTKYFNEDVYIHNLYVTGDEFIANVTNNFVESPYLLLNITGGAIDGGIFFVTGSGFTGINDYGPIIGFDHSNKFKIGVARRSDDLSFLPDIASVQQIEAYSGVANNTFSTITNLALTGSTLDNKINSLSGWSASSINLASTGSTLDSKINSLSGWSASAVNLASTGSTLNTKINNLSGYINSSSSNIVYTTGNQTISGNKTFLNNINVSGSGIFNALDLSSVDTISLSGVDVTITNGVVILTNPITAPNIVYNTGNQTISGVKTFATGIVAPNIVYNTGNQTISGIKTFANGANQILNTTYSNLTGLKATSGLLSGQLYRISDFVLKWNNQSINDQTVKTAASGEPLIVTALSNKQIYHIAQSEIYPQDTIYYNIDANSSYSWGIINNNAAIPDFKGWIYRRIDNLLNIDIPYDWRNIRVNCCKPDVSSVLNYSGNYQYTRLDYVKETGNNSNRGKLYYSVVTGNSGNALNNANFWSPVSDFVESGTFFSTDENYGFRAIYDDPNLGDFIINLPALTSSRIQQPTFTSTLTGLGAFTLNYVKNIKIEDGYSNVIIGNGFYSNTIGNTFIYNTIGNSFYSNTIGNAFAYNTIGDDFGSNTIGNDFSTNTISDYFYSNTIGKSFSSNTIGNYFIYNTIGNGFNSNTIDYSSSSNTIGNNFSSNTIGNSFNANTIGNSFYSNTIGNSFYSNTIGNSFNANTIGNSFYYNTIGNIFESNTIGSSFYYNTIANYFNSNNIGNFFGTNTIGSIFESMTIGNNFRFNTSEDNINGIDLTSSTHVYNTYNTTLFKNAAATQRLRYFNSSDQLVVTDPTA